MNSVHESHGWSRRIARRLAHVACSAALLLAVGACQGVADLVTPGKEGSLPARVAFDAMVSQSVGTRTDAVTLEVVTQYVRRDKSRVKLATRSLPVSSAAQQSVPIPVDLAVCLADPEREALAGATRSCTVVLTLALMVNASTVDRQVIGPLTLTPGLTANVDDPVSLFEITNVELSVGNGPVLASGAVVPAILGSQVGFTAAIRERAGHLVADRAVSWVSDAPAVATVDSHGVVTTIGIGVARITAAIEDVSSVAEVRVSRPPVALSVTAGASTGKGTIRSTPAGIDCQVADGATTGACTFPFAADASIELAVTASLGSVVQGWGGACEAGAPAGVCRLTMTTARAVSARLAALRRVTVAPGEGDGSGRVTGPAGLDCALAGAAATGTCSIEVPHGTEVTLLASPGGAQSLSTFGGWGPGCVDAGAESCSFTLGGSDRAVTAAFRGARVLAVEIEGSGDGLVSAEQGIACRRTARVVGGSCTVDARHGETVVLTASPAATSEFAGWTGDCDAPDAATCRVSLDASRSVTARFSALHRVEVIAGSGDGRGRITGPNGLDCLLDRARTSGTCEVALLDGQDAKLTATPDGSTARKQTFAGWGNDCVGSKTKECALSQVTRARTVTAVFYDEQPVTVNLVGVGTGRAASAGGGIACIRASGTTTGKCAESLPWGTVATVTAMPDSTSSFSGWSGCEIVNGNTCTVTIGGPLLLTATFSRAKVPLALVASGAGAGTMQVNGQPICGISAGAIPRTCTLLVDIGASITVTNLAGAGAVSGGLTGDCTGVTSCTFVVAGPATVRGRFDVAQVPSPTLLLNLTGAGAGRITFGSALDCSVVDTRMTGTCAAAIPFGTTVVLTAVPGPNATVGRWGGPCQKSTGLTCTLVMRERLTLNIRFDPAP